MKATVIVLMVVLVTVPSARADVGICCSCSLDATMRGLIVPADSPASPLGAFTVTVKNDACIPIHNAVVEVIITGQYDGKTHLCASAVVMQYTDEFGVATFNIPGGGCDKERDAFQIRANGVPIRIYDAVMSPDYVAADNAGQPGKWDLRVGLSDFVSFAHAFGYGVASCHDYDNNGATNVADFALFGRFWNDASGGCH